MATPASLPDTDARFRLRAPKVNSVSKHTFTRSTRLMMEATLANVRLMPKAPRSTLSSRAQGALVGQIVGDALGSAVTIAVALVDDQQLIRAGFRMVVNSQGLCPGPDNESPPPRHHHMTATAAGFPNAIRITRYSSKVSVFF